MLLLTSPSSPCLQACGSQEARRIATPCFLLRCGSGRARRARLRCFRQQKEWYRYGSSICRSPQSTSRRRNKIHDLHNLTIPTPSPLCNTSLATLPFHPPSSLNILDVPRVAIISSFLPLPRSGLRGPNSCLTARKQIGEPVPRPQAPQPDRRTPRRRRSPPIPTVRYWYLRACLPHRQHHPPTARRAALNRSSPET